MGLHMNHSNRRRTALSAASGAIGGYSLCPLLRHTCRFGLHKLNSSLPEGFEKFLRTLLRSTLTVVAFLAPWLHLLVFKLSMSSFGSSTDFVFFGVLLPIPICAFVALATQQTTETPWLHRVSTAFLWGSLLYSPVLFLILCFIGFSRSFGI
jgi:hypothetical protein